MKPRVFEGETSLFTYKFWEGTGVLNKTVALDYYDCILKEAIGGFQEGHFIHRIAVYSDLSTIYLYDKIYPVNPVKVEIEIRRKP